jgi:hypothetical protein
MVFLAVASGFFSKAQLETFSGLLVALSAAFLSLLPLLVIWLQLKLRNEINELRRSMARNGGKLDVVQKQTSRRAADGQVVVTGEVRIVPGESLGGSELQTDDFPQRRRDDAQQPLLPEVNNGAKDSLDELGDYRI